MTVSFAPTDPLFPTFPNAAAAFPRGRYPAASRHPGDLARPRERARLDRRASVSSENLVPGTAIAVDANLNRGISMDSSTRTRRRPLQGRPDRRPGHNRTRRYARRRRQTRLVPDRAVVNGFRRMDLLADEGAPRIRGSHRGPSSHRPACAHRVLHISKFRNRRPTGSRLKTAPTRLDRGPTGADTPNNLVASATWNSPAAVRSERMAVSGVSHNQSGSPYTIRYAGDPTGSRLTGGAATADASRASPVPQYGARRFHQLRGPVTLPEPSSVGADRIEIRADMFNVFNNQNLLAAGYIGLVGNPQFRRAHGRSERLPRTAIPVRGDLSVLSGDRLSQTPVYATAIPAFRHVATRSPRPATTPRAIAARSSSRPSSATSRSRWTPRTRRAPPRTS